MSDLNPTFVIGGFFLVLFTILLVRLALWPKNDIIETHESTVRIAACLTCMLAFFVLFASGGIVLQFNFFNQIGWKSLYMFPLTATMVFPIIYAAVSYIRIPKALQNYYEIGSAQNTRFKSEVIRSARLLGLKCIPSTTVSACQNRYFPPTIFGRWGAIPTLVLPNDFEKAIFHAARGNRDIAQSIASFVIFHELSHIKNGDYQFISWIVAFFRAAKWWVVIFAIVIAIYLFLLGTAKIAITFIVFSWLLLWVFLLCWASSRLVLKQREYLADARAVTCMPESDWQRLFKSTTERISPFERLLLHFSTQRMMSKKQTLGSSFALTKIVGLIYSRLGQIFAFLQVRRLLVLYRSIFARLRTIHPVSKQRISALLASRYISEIKPFLSLESSLFAFVIVGVTFVLTFVNVVMLGQKKPIAMGIGLALYCSAIIYIAILLCLPLRNITTTSVNIRSIIWGNTVRCITGSLALFLVFSLVSVVLLFIRPKQYLEVLLVSGQGSLFFGFSTIVMTVIFVLLIRAGMAMQTVRTGGVSLTFMSVVAAFCVLVPSVATGYLLFWPLILETPSRYGACLVLLGFALTLVAALKVSLFVTYRAQPRYSNPLLREVVKYYLLFSVIFWMLMILSGFPIAKLTPTVYQTLANSPPVLRYIVLSGLLLVIVGLAVSLAIRHFRVQMVMFLPLLDVAILSNVCLNKPHEIFCDVVRRTLNKLRKANGGYAYCPDAYADLEVTRRAVRALQYINKGGITDFETVSWISSHRNKNSAYTHRPNAKPSVGATYAALDALSFLNALPQDSEAQEIATWLLQQQDDHGGFQDDPISKSSSLADTVQTLHCLSWLGMGEVVDKQQAAEFITRKWASSSRGISEIHLAITGLSVLDVHEKAVLLQLQRWPRLNLQWVISLRPDRNADVLAKYLEIVKFVMPQNANELAKIEACLGSRVELAVRKLIGKSLVKRESGSIL